VSTDQGGHWEKVWLSPKAQGRERVDLSKWVTGRYEYHIRFELKGRPGSSRLSSLKLMTWVQLAPMSLPRLKTGINHLRFVWGDKHGLATEPSSMAPELSDSEDAKRWGVKVEGEYHPRDRTMRARGQVTVRVDALADTRIRWLHIGGAFNTRREGGKQGPDRIYYSLRPGTGWKLLREETPPTWDEHWYYNMEAELRLERPAKSVWVRLDPVTAANGLRVYAHCEPERAQQGGPVTVTHAYRVGGKLKTQSFRFSSPREYQIHCEGEPENVYVRIAVPSRKK